MKHKYIWILVSCLMTLFLIMTSCSTETTPSVKQEKGSDEVIIKDTTKETGTVTKPDEEKVVSSDVPQYGGTLNTFITADISSFDSGTGGSAGAFINIVYDQYMVTDWRRGPAGSGVTNLLAGAGAVEDYFQPCLAESWEMPSIGVWVLNFREGVHWQPVDSEAGRLMNGREVTADDIVSSLKRLLEAPRSWINISRPNLLVGLTYEKTGPMQVTITTPTDPWTSHNWIIQGGGFNCLYPPEVVEKYGDMETDWRKAVGTGPFMITDYVTGSLITFEKNPTYWETDPVGPGTGKQLPYIDVYKQFIIPDVSTQLAGLRTGKLDFMSGIEAPSAKPLIQTTPGLEYTTYMSNTPWVIAMNRLDSSKPFHDVRVRQAMMLATDFEAIKNDYFEGNADINVWPVNKQTTALYVPMEELPASVQELYSHNIEKAKQLLTDAGYPDGFKAKILGPSDAQRVDELSIFVDQWAAVGIEIELDIRESGVYNGINIARSHEDLVYRYLWGTFTQQLYLSGLRGGSWFNPSFVGDETKGMKDPFIESVFEAVNANMFINNEQAYTEYKKITPYVLEQAYYIVRPTPYTYSFWWPWVKNCYGQGALFAKHFWIDKDLKKSMGY